MFSFCSPDFDLLLVVGGIDLNGETLAEVELVSLDPDNHPVPPCLTSLQELPAASHAVAGAVDEDGNPFICGGKFEDGYSDMCYKYDPQTNSWELSGTMPYERAYMADTVVPGLGLVMVGGFDGQFGNLDGTDEVIATTDGVFFQELAPLPEPSSSGTYNSETPTCQSAITYFHKM